MSKPTSTLPQEPAEQTATGLATGVALGAGLGVVIWLTTGQFIFFPIFVGVGISIGTALDANRQRETTDEEKSPEDELTNAS